MKNKNFIITVSALLFLSGYLFPVYSQAIIIDHNFTNLSQIPVRWIEKAKQKLHIAYGHTSHGSQLVSGMQGLVKEKGSLFSFNKGGLNGALDFHDRAFSKSRHDLGHRGDTSWADLTRQYLNNPVNSKCNVVIWSWCGGCSDNTISGINTYLKTMDQLEKEYPNVIFVYMTGHLDGSGERGNLHKINQRIREFCNRNNKILFDFADIESYDPYGNYFLNKGANDNCDYGAGDNWAKEWCRKHPGKCWYKGSCAHSHPFNCQRKGIAAWWLWAELAQL